MAEGRVPQEAQRRAQLRGRGLGGLNQVLPLLIALQLLTTEERRLEPDPACPRVSAADPRQWVLLSSLPDPRSPRSPGPQPQCCACRGAVPCQQQRVEGLLLCQTPARNRE